MISSTLLISAGIAGILMFLAPCTLPIIPGYLLFISGQPITALPQDSAKRRRRIFGNALAFVCGFSFVFILLGVFAGSIGSLVGPHREILSRLSGIMMILFGFMMIGSIRLPFLGGEWHAKIPSFLTVGTASSSLIIGSLFALGWSPCIGPILGTVLLVATTSATKLQGGILLAAFSVGLGIPFILTALLIDTASSFITRIGKGAVLISRLSGLLLIALGFIILLGQMGVIFEWSYRLFDYFGYSRLYQYL